MIDKGGTMTTNKKNWVIFSLLFCSILLLTGCTGRSMPDAYRLLENLSLHFPAIWRLTSALSYILGFIFFLKGMLGLKSHGENRGGGSGGGLGGPLTLIVVGAVLIYSPSTFNVLMATAFGYSSPLALPTQSSYAANYSAILLLVQLIGFISFIRGWIMITKVSPHNQQVTMGKAFTHIVGGILAINIGGTIDILQNTLGL